MMTLGAVGRAADDSFYDLMILLIHDLKLARPKRNEFVDPGFRGVQVGGGLKPH